VANDGPKTPRRMTAPKEWRYGIHTTDPGWVRDGFYLRRLVRDHNTPCVRFPREMIRNLGWKQGDLLAVLAGENGIFVTKLEFADPEVILYDSLDEVRRKYSSPGTAHDHEG